VIAGAALHPRAYRLINRLHIPMVLSLTESPYMDMTQADMMKITQVKAALTNEKLSAARLQDVTGIKTVYLPHSINPEVHKPSGFDDTYQTEVFFHGTLWPERIELLTGIKPAHVTGYTLDGEPYNSKKMLIDNGEMALWYSNTKIALNHHRISSEYEDDNIPPAFSLGPRGYEIAACGAFQLCDDTRPELQAVFGDAVATYSDKHTLQSAIDYYLKHDLERQQMATEARRRVQTCTFENRVNKIVLPLLQEVVTNG
jgi:spore maturation protein CgeB